MIIFYLVSYIFCFYYRSPCTFSTLIRNFELSSRGWQASKNSSTHCHQLQHDTAEISLESYIHQNCVLDLFTGVFKRDPTSLNRCDGRISRDEYIKSCTPESRNIHPARTSKALNQSKTFIYLSYKPLGLR